MDDNNRPLIIKPLQVILQTNIKGMETVPLEFSMFTNLGEYRGNPNYKYPFFTDSVKYPSSAGTNRATALEFFFNRSTFETTLKTAMIDYVDTNIFLEESLVNKTDGEDVEALKKKARENGDYNIMFMLRCLLQVDSAFGKVLSSSFHQQIEDKFNPEIFSFSMKSLFYGNTAEATVHIKGKDYIIGDLIWLNDIVNHPIYRDFLKQYYGKIKERESYIPKINTIFSQKLKKLLINLHKYINGINTSKFSTFTDELKNAIQKSNLISGGKKDNKINPTIDPLRTEDFRKQDNEIRQLINNRIDPSGQFIKFADMNVLTETINKLQLIMSSFIKIHMLITEQNEQKDYQNRLTISSDVWRDFTNIYIQMISFKSVTMVKEFVSGNKQKLDLKEKFADGSNKPLDELDIIRDIKANYGKYVLMSEGVGKITTNVTDPIRVSSNLELEKAIFELKESSSRENNHGQEFRDIYLRIFENNKQMKLYPEIMYTGVNSVSLDKSPVMAEIYLYMNLVDKSKYETTKLKCNLKNEMAANELLNIMNRKHSYLVNPYRLYGNFEISQPSSLVGNKKNALNQLGKGIQNTKRNKNRDIYSRKNRR